LEGDPVDIEEMEDLRGKGPKGKGTPGGERKEENSRTEEGKTENSTADYNRIIT